jgi:hypothetical protein
VRGQEARQHTGEQAAAHRHQRDERLLDGEGMIAFMLTGDRHQVGCGIDREERSAAPAEHPAADQPARL